MAVRGFGADFHKLWAGQSVSLVGTQITQIALPLVAIYTLHAGPVELGLLGTAQWLPFLLVALWAGAWSDRRRRLPVLIATDAMRSLLLAGIALLAAWKLLNIVLLIGIVFVFGVCTVIFEVSYNSYVPFLVSHGQLVPANSRLQASQSTAEVGGPGLGGLLVQFVSAWGALFVDALSFVVSTMTLIWIREREPQPAPQTGERGILAQIAEGVRLVLRTPVLRALVGTAALYNMFHQWIFALFALFAVNDLGFSAGAIGMVLSSGAIGSLFGSMLASTAMRRFGVGGAMIGPVTIECLVMLAIPLAPTNRLVATPLLVAAFVLNGMFTTLSSVVALSVRQTITSPHLLGRMNATYRFISYGVMALGAFLGGLSGQLFGLRAGLAIGTALLLTTVVWVVLSPLRGMRDLPEPVVPEPEIPTPTLAT
jgi:MFS family permease